MDQVYLLVDSSPFDGDDVLGVYSNRDHAMAEAKDRAIKRQGNATYRWDITESGLELCFYRRIGKTHMFRWLFSGYVVRQMEVQHGTR